MPRCHIDHIAITAPTLEAGAELVRLALGVEPQAGGAHARMGTHNLLLRLGDAVYLEVIAPDPRAPLPSRPRWFALATLAADAVPALATWVARTTDIQASVAACSEPLGNIEAMSRGALNWLITIPDDGALPLNGVAPALIEWQAEAHPAAKLQDHGLSLIKLELFHPEPERIARLLLSLGLDSQLTVHPSTGERGAGLVAHIDTPQGPRQL
ncbi:VOC family protein [Janthinobacterium sp. FW305-128]|uniref:VOC family protein n=1 Tax=Janthinobacterium sp. FW305-128 TaxID=2775055 RepID=UPI001E5ED541|nr:VOC family protein [Janthinobacterium sp. FW305-128]MCC7680465.1 VOC family protein [Janthinobacterium sp. FW305-128]